MVRQGRNKVNTFTMINIFEDLMIWRGVFSGSLGGFAKVEGYRFFEGCENFPRVEVFLGGGGYISWKGGLYLSVPHHNLCHLNLHHHRHLSFFEHSYDVHRYNIIMK